MTITIAHRTFLIDRRTVNVVLFVGLFTLVFALLSAAYSVPPLGSDWKAFLWPQLEQPFSIQPGVYNLPWLFVLLQPLRLLGPVGSIALLQTGCFGAVWYAARKMRITPLRTVLLFLSPPVLWGAFMGQIDGLIVLAYFAPPALAGALALVKPQTALAAGWSAFLARPLLVTTISAALFGSAFALWRYPYSIVDANSIITTSLWKVPALFISCWSWTLYPGSLVLVPLLLWRPKSAGMVITPFIFPYAAVQSLIGPALYAAGHAPGWLFAVLWLVSWLRLAWMLGLI